MQLLLIRHAQSANNRLFAETGAATGRVPDPDITDLGRRQSEALAGWLAAGNGPRLTHLYSSLMRRTIQTAAPIADALDLPIVARPDAHEHPGVYEGAMADGRAHAGSPRSVLASFSARAQLPDSVTEDGWFTGELEDEAGLLRRARALVADLRAHHGPDDVVGVVSHGWFASTVVEAATGAAAGTWFMHHNTATTLLSWETWLGDGEAEARPQLAVRWVNRADHLTADELSE